ncbi:MAG TPA: bacillithiol biosynthesis deacetylase BshB1 [Chitinophagales bacterium]|nr:bacillithiol biosynthesis deacetylase BshB1 [Chitinophagales bacterium]
MQKLDILLFAAHPDDVELAASGTVLKHISLGYKVGIIDLTKGELGTRGTATIRAQESEAASQILGIHVHENLGFRDGFFEVNEDHLLPVISAIRKYQPDIILANSISDRHPDHGRGGDLVARANFLSGLVKVDTGQPAWRAKAVYRYVQDNFVEPDFVVDITDFMDKKLEAIKAFKSQFYNPDSKEPQTPISRADFLDFIEGRARQFGRPIGVTYAEGFTVERYIGVEDLFDLK